MVQFSKNRILLSEIFAYYSLKKKKKHFFISFSFFISAAKSPCLTFSICPVLSKYKNLKKKNVFEYWYSILAYLIAFTFVQMPLGKGMNSLPLPQLDRLGSLALSSNQSKILNYQPQRRQWETIPRSNGNLQIIFKKKGGKKNISRAMIAYDLTGYGIYFSFFLNSRPTSKPFFLETLT